MDKTLMVLSALLLVLLGMAAGVGLGKARVEARLSSLEEPALAYQNTSSDPLGFDQCVRAGGKVKRSDLDSSVICVVHWLNAEQVREAIR